MCTGCSSPGVKRPRREVDHSPPTSTKVMKSGSVHSLPPTCSWRSGSFRRPIYSLVSIFLVRIYYVSGRPCDWPYRHSVFCFSSVIKLQVLTSCFSCNPPDLNSSKLTLFSRRPKNYSAKLWNSNLLEHENSAARICSCSQKIKNSTWMNKFICYHPGRWALHSS
jgi:hypothetical protein